MEQKKDNKLLKRIGAIIGAIACAIAVLFVPFSHKIEPKNMISASAADNLVITEYSGASIFLPLTYRKLQELGPSTDTVYFGRFYINFYTDGFEWHFWPINGLYPVEHDYITFPLYSYGSNSSTDTRYNKEGDLLGTGSDNGYTFRYTSDSTFDFTRILTAEIGGYIDAGNPWNYIQYTDASNRKVRVDCKVWTDAPSDSTTYSYFVLPYRQYVLSSSLTDSESYNVGYNNGYGQGSSVGYAQGETAGYNTGYSEGVRVGYNSGYNEGLEHGGEYTFTSLVSSFVDVPVRTFTSLLNFELLGINLADFFMSLLTLAIIVTIVRKII